MRKYSNVFLSFLLVVSQLPSAWAVADATFPMVPEDQWTSGSLCHTKHKDFSEFRYQERIPYCRRNVSKKLKVWVYELYGVPEKCRSQYTIDHFIPLAIGGDNSAVNLWPENKAVKRLRYDLEAHLYRQMKKGELKQNEALAIVTNEKWNPPEGVIDPDQLCY